MRDGLHLTVRRLLNAIHCSSRLPDDVLPEAQAWEAAGRPELAPEVYQIERDRDEARGHVNRLQQHLYELEDLVAARTRERDELRDELSRLRRDLNAARAEIEHAWQRLGGRFDEDHPDYDPDVATLAQAIDVAIQYERDQADLREENARTKPARSQLEDCPPTDVDYSLVEAMAHGAGYAMRDHELRNEITAMIVAGVRSAIEQARRARG